MPLFPSALRLSQLLSTTMPNDEKPLLPTNTSPSSSARSSASPTGLPPTSPAAKLLASATAPPRSHRPILSSTKKRWLALILFYAVLAFGWYRNLHSRAWKEAMDSIDRWRTTTTTTTTCIDGSGAVCDAYGQPFSHPAADQIDIVNASLASSQPSSSLGWEADNVYHLGTPLFTSNPAVYLSTLEDFLRQHFPPSDTDDNDPHSLINALRVFFPASTSLNRVHYPPIPQTIWQTAPDRKYYKTKEDIVQTWTEKNVGWDVKFHDNDLADRWVRRRFDLHKDDRMERRSPSPRRARNRKARKSHGTLDGRRQATKGTGALVAPAPRQLAKVIDTRNRGIVAAWDRLATPAVLRSDFWRYLVLAVEGGVYADTDVECMKPVDDWALDVSWEGIPPDDYEPPSCIVGVEADVGDRKDWHKYWPRPLQFSQWTMASARGHPIMLDAVRRVVEQALAPVPETQKLVSVMERTGPGLFTDSVLAYLQVKYRKAWPDLRGLDFDGWRFHHGEHDRGKLSSEGFGDLKVLQITGFSPGIGHMGAENKEHPAAMASHYFAGSWRSQEGADA
ncbi:hypothetical protein JCM10212_002942 [Sporobolomyces blumeae]